MASLAQAFPLVTQKIDIPVMGTNRRELILSILNQAELDLTSGMSASCEYISSALVDKILAQKNNSEEDDSHGRKKYYNRILSIQKSIWDAKEVHQTTIYKNLFVSAQFSVKTHYMYLTCALETITRQIREVLARTSTTGDGFTASPVYKDRHHTLGGVKPASPEKVLQAIVDEIKRRKGDVTDAHLLKEAVSLIQSELDVFSAEDAMNNSILSSLNNSSNDNVITVDNNNDGNGRRPSVRSSVLSPTERPPEKGVAWRPPTAENNKWWYTFNPIWGDPSITRESLSDFMSSVVVSSAPAAKAMLVISSHLNSVIKCIKRILFSKSKMQIEAVDDDPFSKEEVWDDLSDNILPWFVIVSRLILFMDSYRDKYNSETAFDGSGCLLKLLASCVECFPPYLLDTDWFNENVASWPRTAVTRFDFSTDGLCRTLVVTKPRSRHPFMPQSVASNNDSVTYNRLSKPSAEFVSRVMLREYMEQVEAGTKLLVRSISDDGDNTARANDQKPFGVFISVPSEVDEYGSPFLLNPLYLTKEMNVSPESNIQTYKTIDDIIRPVFLKRALTDSWKCIRLFIPDKKNVEIIDSVWKSLSLAGESTAFKKVFDTSLKTAGDLRSLLEQNATPSAFKNVAESIGEVEEGLGNISSFETEHAVRTECSLFLTALWALSSDKIIKKVSLSSI